MEQPIDYSLFREHGIQPGHAVHPGHPITLAFCIVKAFPSYAAAFAPTEHNWAAALGSLRIPGAGGCVTNALALLRDLHKGMTFDAAVAQADDMWAQTDSMKKGGGPFAKTPESEERFKARWKEGQDQADLVKPLLAACKKWWKK